MEKPLLTVREYAQMHGATIHQVIGWIGTGKLGRPFKRNRQWLIRADIVPPLIKKCANQWPKSRNGGEEWKNRKQLRKPSGISSAL